MAVGLNGLFKLKVVIGLEGWHFEVREYEDRVCRYGMVVLGLLIVRESVLRLKRKLLCMGGGVVRRLCMRGLKYYRIGSLDGGKWGSECVEGRIGREVQNFKQVGILGNYLFSRGGGGIATQKGMERG